MGRKRKSKSKDQIAHAKCRAYQRFGLQLNNDGIDGIISRIHDGTAEFIEKQSNRISRFRLPIKGQDVDIIYDKTRKTIVTFLPPKEPRITE